MSNHREHRGQVPFCLCMSMKTRALSPLLWAKLNIRSEKEPVQTGASLPANKLCPLLSTQWNLQIRGHSAGVQDVQGHPLPPISKRVAGGTQKKAQKRKGYENRIQNEWRKCFISLHCRAGWVPGKCCCSSLAQPQALSGYLVLSPDQGPTARTSTAHSISFMDMPSSLLFSESLDFRSRDVRPQLKHFLKPLLSRDL